MFFRSFVLINCKSESRILCFCPLDHLTIARIRVPNDRQLDVKCPTCLEHIFRSYFRGASFVLDLEQHKRMFCVHVMSSHSDIELKYQKLCKKSRFSPLFPDQLPIHRDWCRGELFVPSSMINGTFKLGISFVDDQNERKLIKQSP